MKQYDKIFVPGAGNYWLADEHRGRVNLLERLKQEYGVVVLTPAQLRADLLFIIYEGHGIGFDFLPEIVDNYLKAKGVNL